jgi:hypothetical protein
MVLDQKKVLEEEFNKKICSLNYKIQEIESDIIINMGLKPLDAVTLEIHEYRDDRISCFAVAQTVECFLKEIGYTIEDEKIILVPTLLKKKNSKRAICFPSFMSWTLKKDGSIILEHVAKQHIIPEKYSEASLESIRRRLLELQKI